MAADGNIYILPNFSLMHSSSALKIGQNVNFKRPNRLTVTAKWVKLSAATNVQKWQNTGIYRLPYRQQDTI